MKTFNILFLILVLVLGIAGVALVAHDSGTINPLGVICIAFAVFGLIFSAKESDKYHVRDIDHPVITDAITFNSLYAPVKSFFLALCNDVRNLIKMAQRKVSTSRIDSQYYHKTWE